MNNLLNMLWIESRKAIRSRLPLWTALGSLFMPLGIAFLLFVARNPAISQKLGLVSDKANLLAYSATVWAAYVKLSAQMIAAGGYFLFVLVISWVFGREFADGTLKDLLAVPVRRSIILLAKFIVVGIWSLILATVIIIAIYLAGVLIALPGGSLLVTVTGGILMLVTACLVILSVTPFAFFASLGRGYLLPISMAVLVLVLANFVVVLGWGNYFPWSVPALFSQQASYIPPLSYWLVFLTGLAGMLITYLWWMNADQNR